MKSADIRRLVLIPLLILSFAPFSGNGAEYGDKLKKTPEYKKITTPKGGNSDNDHHHHHDHYYYYHDRFYHPAYPHSYARYGGSDRTGGSTIPGFISFGVAIGKSKFDYDDIDDGDASIFHIGYRPENSRLGYELSFYDSGEAEVTSLTDIDIEVDTVNLVLSFNSSENNDSTLNFFGQGGIYFADTTISGPFDRESESSNGFLIAVGVDIMLSRYFGLRATASNLFDVEDFVDDKSLSFLTLGGQFVF